MAEAATHPFVTYAAYAEREKTSDVRHEWHDGIVIAMAGGTLRHAALTMRVGAAIGAALAGRPCEVFSPDARVRIHKTRLGTYPDLSVVCGPIETDPDDPTSLLNPILLVEVLSDSTEAYDRGAKFAHYRAIPSLDAVLFVRTNEPGLELFAKRPDGAWELYEKTTGALRIEALDITLDVDAIFREPLPPK